MTKANRFLWFRANKFEYRITSNNSRGNYQFFIFFPAGIIGGRELLEGGNY